MYESWNNVILAWLDLPVIQPILLAICAPKPDGILSLGFQKGFGL